MTLLIDSNVIIYAVQAEFCDLRRWIIDNDPQYSIISRVEVLGYAGLQSGGKLLPTYWIIYKSFISAQIVMNLPLP